MTTNIKMVVLDMAGTTVDEQNVVYKTLHKAICEAGYEVTLNDVLATGAGMEKLQAIKAILNNYAGISNDVVAEKIFQNFSKQLNDAYSTYAILPQPGAIDTFSALKTKGITVVLNTGYSSSVAGNILNKLGWRKGIEYDELITASNVKVGRPAPDMILLAAQKHGISPTEVVKVGDSVIDIEEGKNAGCALSIGITTGAHTLEQLQSAQPDYIINNLLELLPLV